MIDLVAPYELTVVAMGATAALLFIQLAVLDVIGIKSGHTPGHPVEPSHDSALFRASRALSNTNESVGIFVLGAMFAVFCSAVPFWVNLGAAVYFVGRLGHMVFYYLNKSLLRSISFGLSALGLLIIIIAGFSGLIGGS